MDQKWEKMDHFFALDYKFILDSSILISDSYSATQNT